MKTDELIDRLGRDVTVARPLPAPGMRTAVWMVWAVGYLVVVAVMMFAVMSSAGVTSTPLYLVQQSAALVTGIMAARAAFASVIPGANNRVWVHAGNRGSGMGRVAVVGRRARSAGVWDAGRDQSERLALRRLNDSGRSGRRGSSRLDVAARRSADARPHGLPRRVGRVERRQYRSVPDAPSCVRTDGPPVAWRHVAAVAALCALMGRRWFRWPDMTTR